MIMVPAQAAEVRLCEGHVSGLQPSVFFYRPT
jgi:hypothetical protein